VLARIEQDKREQWLAELTSPLAGTPPDRVSPEVIEQEMSAFMAFQGETGG
jgi:hypothetical protein